MTASDLPAAARADLDAGLAALGLDQALAEPLTRYLSLLQRWNAAYNLTAIRDPREMVTKHLLDSLAMVPAMVGVPGLKVGVPDSGADSGEPEKVGVPDPDPRKVGVPDSLPPDPDPRKVGVPDPDSDSAVPDSAALADLGTGPGLPGIPLAIAIPGLRVTLVESNGKKARFLREAVRTLGLGDVEVAESRIEALDRPGRYAAITARALATLPQILVLGGHLLAADGVLLAMKGARPDDEIAALPPGWVVREVRPLRVPGLDAERHLVVIGREPAAPGT
jgi:16S rRNA (guanine527-N7)-methyltransferase